MTLHPWLIYALGMAIVVPARDIHGSVIAGEVNESVTITNTETHAAAGKDRGDRHGDRIGWAIAIVGVLVAAAQFAHDAFGFFK